MKDSGARTILVLLLLIGLCANDAFAGAASLRGKANLEIVVHHDWPSVLVGSQPLRLDVVNKGKTREVRFEVVPGYGRGTTVRKTLKLEGSGQRVSFTLPLQTSGPSTLEVYVEGTHIPAYDTPLSLVPGYSSFDFPTVFVTPSPVTGMSDIENMHEQVFGGSGGNIERVGPGSLPTTWKGYTGLSALLIDADCAGSIPSSQVEEIWKWVAVGGSLTIYNINAVSQDAILKLQPASGLNLKPDMIARNENNLSHHGYMLGTYGLLANAMDLPSTWERLFGVIPDASLQAVYSSPVFEKQWGGSGRHSSSGYYGFGGGPTATPVVEDDKLDEIIIPGVEDQFRVPGVGEPPLGLFWVAIVLFVIVIGPVNFLVLWKRRRQVLLVVTAPALAGVAIVLMVVFALVGDGLAVRSLTRSITYLDMKNRTAVTQAQLFLYAGMAPGDGLAFGDDATLVGNSFDYQDMYNRHPYGYSSSRESTPVRLMDCTEGERYLSGWLESRTQVVLATASVIHPARERVLFRKEAEGITVENGLGVDIENLEVIAGERLYKVKELAAGGSVTVATPSQRRFSGLNTARRQLLMRSQPGASARLADNAFFCETLGSPFLRTGLEDMESQDGSKHILVGEIVWEQP